MMVVLMENNKIVEPELNKEKGYLNMASISIQYQQNPWVKKVGKDLKKLIIGETK